MTNSTSSIKELRKIEGLSVSDISKLTKIDKKRYKLIEKNSLIATREELYSIAYYLDVTPAVFNLKENFNPNLQKQIKEKREQNKLDKHKTLNMVNPTKDVYDNYDLTNINKSKVKQISKPFIFEIFSFFYLLLLYLCFIAITYNSVTYKEKNITIQLISSLINSFSKNEIANIFFVISFSISILMFITPFLNTFNYKFRNNIVSKLITYSGSILCYVFLITTFLVIFDKYEHKNISYYNYILFGFALLGVPISIGYNFIKHNQYKLDKLVKG